MPFRASIYFDWLPLSIGIMFGHVFSNWGGRDRRAGGLTDTTLCLSLNKFYLLHIGKSVGRRRDKTLQTNKKLPGFSCNTRLWCIWGEKFVSLKPVDSIQSLFDTIRFDTNSSCKIAKNFVNFKYSLRVSKKNILGEYSSFFYISTE